MIPTRLMAEKALRAAFRVLDQDRAEMIDGFTIPGEPRRNAKRRRDYAAMSAGERSMVRRLDRVLDLIREALK